VTRAEDVEFRVARVIAALDASGGDIATVGAAVEFAARLGAEVAGLFIEDANLFRLAALPVTRHLALRSQAPSAFDAARLEADLRAGAARAEAELGAAATRRGLRWSFRVVRGLPAAELTAATVVEDVLVVGPPPRVSGLPLGLGGALALAACRCTRTLLMATASARIGRPLVVLDAGSALTARVLTAAARLAAPGQAEVALLILGGGREAALLEQDAAAWLSRRGFRPLIGRLERPSATALLGRMHAGGHDVLVLPADLPSIAEDGLEALMTAADGQVLVVR